MWFCVEKVKIDTLKGKIFNFNENNENHKVYPSACDPDNSAPQLDKSAPQKNQIGTCVFFFDYTYKTSNSLEPIPNFNHVCSGKDPDSNSDP